MQAIWSKQDVSQLCTAILPCTYTQQSNRVFTAIHELSIRYFVLLTPHEGSHPTPPHPPPFSTPPHPLPLPPAPRHPHLCPPHNLAIPPHPVPALLAPTQPTVPPATPPHQVQLLCLPDTPLEGLSSSHGPANDHNQLLDAKLLCYQSILGIHIVLDSNLHDNHGLIERVACAGERGSAACKSVISKPSAEEGCRQDGEGRVVDLFMLGF